MRACQYCGTTKKLQRCSGCKKTTYCSADCQKTDWPQHKPICKNNFVDIPNIEEHITFLNHTVERKMATHGQGTVPVTRDTKKVKAFIKEIGCDPKSARLMYVDPGLPVGDYGRCWHNSKLCADRYGGTVVFGWSIFENEFLFEAEMHCVVKSAADGHYYNVTRFSDNDETFRGLFVEDKTTEEHAKTTGTAAKSFVLWK